MQTFINQGAVVAIQVDTTLPQITSFTPLASNIATSVNASGQVQVTVTFNQNIKTSSLNASSIIVERSGGTGNFTNPIAVPILTSSLTETYLKTSTGAEQVSFLIPGPLPNDQYAIILKGTGSTPITDLASNPLSGAFVGTFPTGNGTTGSDFSTVGSPFVIYTPTSAHLIYVESPSTFDEFITGTAATQGSRENPFTTIAAGLSHALIGDDVIVLPGTYSEDVNVPPGIRLVSGSQTSTDTTYTPGSPLQTLIYGVPFATSSGTSSLGIMTLETIGSVPGVPTEISGFSIISPLFGDPNTGVIDPSSIAVQAYNSNAIIDRNIIINGGIGLNLSTGGSNAAVSTVYDNLIAGNINGVVITDNGATSSVQGLYQVTNNTIVDNTIGLLNVSATPNVLQAIVQNNIFYSNHDTTTARTGTGIHSYAVDTLGVGTNLFYANGASATNPATNAVGTFTNFVPSALASTPDALGNFIGNPYFAQPEDPRPTVDTPAVFFNYANFDLTSRSAAINTAKNSVAPSTDFLYRTAVQIPGRGFPGTGPASIGAYYYLGTGVPPTYTGIAYTGGATTVPTTGGGGNPKVPVGGGNPKVPVGGGKTPIVSAAEITVNNSSVGGGIALGTKAFSVLTTSLSSIGTVSTTSEVAAASVVTQSPPSYIDVNFSDSIDPSTVTANDLVLSGSGLSTSNPAKATSLAWIDDHAVRFYLSGGFNNSGSVNVTIPKGALSDSMGASLDAYTNSFQIGSTPATATSPVTPTTLLSTMVPVAQPLAVSGPVAAAAVAVPVSSPAHSQKNAASKVHHTTTSKAKAAHKAPAKAAHKAPAKAAVHHAAVKPAVHKAQTKQVKAAKVSKSSHKSKGK